MYTIELTDEYILIYNTKTKELIKEEIPYNIIKDNQIYDFIRLNKILSKIVEKHKMLNSLFKTKINILLFSKKSPSEIYLVKNLLNSFSNINLEIIYPSKYFDNNHIFISGKNLYYNNKKVETLIQNEYILIGYNEDYEKLQNNINKNYNIKIYKYENSKTIIFEKI